MYCNGGRCADLTELVTVENHQISILKSPDQYSVTSMCAADLIGTYNKQKSPNRYSVRFTYCADLTELVTNGSHQ